MPNTKYKAAIIKTGPALGLLLICFFIYLPAMQADFAVDDWHVVKDNERITDIRFIPDYFTSDVWSNTTDDLTHNFKGYNIYRPLFLIVLNLGHHLWGESATGFHSLNIFFHFVNSLLVFYLISNLIPNRSATPAFFGATIFAVHPVHIESAAWISGITDPLVAMFLLGNFLVYRHYLTTGKRAHAALALFLFGCGLLSKEVAVFYPMILLISDWISGKLAARRYLPYLALIAVYFVARANAMGTSVEMDSYDLTKFPVLIEYVFRYMNLLVLPWPSNFHFHSPPAPNLFALISGGIASLIALALLWRAVETRESGLLQSYAWFAIPLLPALPIALMGNGMWAIRILYLPCAGLAIFAAWTYQRYQIKKAWTGLLWAVVSIYAAVSISEVGTWKNDETLFTVNIERSPTSAMYYGGLAKAIKKQGKIDQAIELYSQALDLSEDQAGRLTYMNNIAVAYGENGVLDKSEYYFRQILEIMPDDSKSWVGLGNIALARRQFEPALEFYLKAYQFNPRSYVALYNLALVYRAMGNIEKAVYYENKARQRQ